MASFALGKQDPAGVPIKEIHDPGKRPVPPVMQSATRTIQKGGRTFEPLGDLCGAPLPQGTASWISRSLLPFFHWFTCRQEQQMRTHPSQAPPQEQRTATNQLIVWMRDEHQQRFRSGDKVMKHVTHGLEDWR